MIGEFCPKVFALKMARRSGLGVMVAKFGAEASALTVTGTGTSAFFTARGGRWTSADCVLSPLFSII